MAVDSYSPAPKTWQPRKAVAKILGIGALACSVGVIPALFDPGHTLDDIEHSAAVKAGLAFSLFFLAIAVGSMGMQHRARSDRSPWPVYWGILGTLFTLGMLAIILPSLSAYRLAVDLDARGVPAQAQVIRRYTEGCGKSGCVTELNYAFTARQKGRSARIAGEGEISGRAGIERRYVLSTGTIPILFDPEDPTHSEMNWDGEVHRQVVTGVSGEVAFLAALLMFFLGLLAALLYPVADAASHARSGLI